MSIAVQRITPPAAPVRTADLPGWRVLLQMTRNVLGVWSDRCFEEMILRSRNFGGKAILVNDPEAARHVLGGGARYGRPVSVFRLARPIVGDGLLLSQGAEWKRQRRMLAPIFSPAGVGELLPHLQAAAEALVRRLEGAPRADLSQQMHQTALDATERALFSRAVDDRERLGLARMLQRYGRRWRFQRARRAMLEAVVAERRAAGGADGRRRDLVGHRRPRQRLLSPQHLQSGCGPLQRRHRLSHYYLQRERLHGQLGRLEEYRRRPDLEEHHGGGRPRAE